MNNTTQYKVEAKQEDINNKTRQQTQSNDEQWSVKNIKRVLHNMRKAKNEQKREKSIDIY